MKIGLFVPALLLSGLYPAHGEVAGTDARGRTTAEAAAPAVTAVSVVPATGRAEVVVSVESSVQVRDFALSSPRRVVVDLTGARVAGSYRGYDRVARGGITNVRIGQFRPDVVRVVIELDGPRTYQVTRSANEVKISVAGGGDFAAWSSSDNQVASGKDQVREAAPRNDRAAADASDAATASNATIAEPAPGNPLVAAAVAQQQSTQPRITVTYQDADIRDVIAAFAAFSGRTIVVGKDVAGTVTAEIRNQPWDVALRAILSGQGLAAAEDVSSNIITVDSYANIQSKQSSEPMVTQIIPVNYAKSDSLAPIIRTLLAKDCTAGVPAAAGQPAGQSGCVVRGVVASDPATNTLLITEAPTRMAGLLSYVKSLDVRTPQVAIKAKIIFVNRSDIQDIGLSYDLGTGNNQFFSQLVKRFDPLTGTAIPGDRIALGGNALSAIANANARVVNPALSLVFSTALGKFQLTSFLNALQEVRLADVQAEPSIVTLDNRKAEILVGQEIPIRVLDASAAAAGGVGGALVPRATVTLKEVGILLSVTPHITNNRQILLDLHAENSDAQLASSDVGFIFNKQRADNRLLVNDGETAVIGGLTVTQVTQSKSGIPLLVDLPVIGRLFGQTRKQEEKRELLILVTPRIMEGGVTVSMGPAK